MVPLSLGIDHGSWPAAWRAKGYLVLIGSSMLSVKPVQNLMRTSEFGCMPAGSAAEPSDRRAGLDGGVGTCAAGVDGGDAAGGDLAAGDAAPGGTTGGVRGGGGAAAAGLSHGRSGLDGGGAAWPDGGAAGLEGDTAA